jgi:hypothetical protein
MKLQDDPTDFWWPNPQAFDDLTVEFEDTEDGGSLIHLDAPDGTECAEWLSFYQETPERLAAFEKEFMRTLLEHAQRLINGETQVQSDEQDSDRSDCQEDLSGAIQEH